jgi:plastocyanin
MSLNRCRPRGLALAAGFACVLLNLAACSSSGGGSSQTTTNGPSTSPSSASPSATAGATSAVGAGTIVTKNFAFSPATLTVAPGTKITVTNQDQTAHTLTATTGGAFDTGTIDAGKSATFTAPAQPGDYAFMCSIHPFMKGTLTVK